MTENARLELYKSHRDGQEKYTYFLLAAAGTAIGFAVTQTKTAILSWWMTPLGLAVVCWAASFFSGCKHLQRVNSLVRENYQVLRAKAGLHPHFPADQTFVKSIESDLEEKTWKSGSASRWQFSFLILGALLFILWHILEMYQRTVSGISAH